MTINNQIIIDNIIEQMLFSDGTSVKQRASKIIFKDLNIGFSIDITSISLPEAEKIRDITISKLAAKLKEYKISIVLTSSSVATSATAKNPYNANQKPKIYIEGVKNVILIASGKGGVGKSTIAALLAYKLAAEGKKVGIIDADIYGPSIPNIFALSGKPILQNNRMIPLKSYQGIEINSIGFLTKDDAAISWRGPMATKAIYQLLSLTHWSDLDYLIIDSPPGTGDIHLSIIENYHINYVLMVTTPQKISELDVSRSINLYQKFAIPILGIIENMSYYIDKQTKQKIELFAGRAGEQLANKHNIDLLAQVEINPQLSYACDAGLNLSQFTYLLNDIIFHKLT